MDFGCCVCCPLVSPRTCSEDYMLTGFLEVVLAVTTYAKKVMLSVDVSELERLKYPYKGA